MHDTYKMQSLVRTLTLAPMALFNVNGPQKLFYYEEGAY
jgi:hypothetical protein